MNRNHETQMKTVDVTASVAEHARELDADDELRGFRQEFIFPRREDGSAKRYFCGNSLGLQHRSVAGTVEEVLASWQERAVDGHFAGKHPWLTYHEQLREGQAALLGAAPEGIVTMNTLTVNLHLAMVSFYRPRGKRRKILIEKQAFPSDRYAVESQLRWHGLDPASCLVEMAPEPGQRLLDEARVDDFLQTQGDEVALVLWPGVQYVTGQAFDLPRIAQAARRAGARIGFDLAHSAGNVPVQLDHSDCDFAIWCTYKYLNAGPGAVAGLYIHQRHWGRSDLPRFHGWYGNDPSSRFRMSAEFQPADGAEAWVLSNPPVLAMAPLMASLEVFRRAGFNRLLRKSLAMTSWLAQQVELNFDDILQIITPSQPERRGCQLSLRVRAGPDAGKILFKFLTAEGVVTDWREPDVIRVAPVPLYNSYQDCWQLLDAVARWANSTVLAG